MLSDPIFKRDSRGQLRTWQFEVEGDKWRTIAGLEDGAKVTAGWTVCTPKSQATAEDQAVFEARAEQTKKLQRDYHETRDGVDLPHYFAPMLAQKYGPVGFPVFSQPKLDGIRCIATPKGLFSRQGKRFFAAPHVEEALAPLFDDNPNLVLDGELYNHQLKDDFNTITSLVRKQKPSDEELSQAAALIQYHVYDVPTHPGRFSARIDYAEALLMSLNSDVVCMVSTYVAVDQLMLDATYAQYIEQGYEGQMVRMDAPYEQKRSRSLLKRKEFQDSEFEIIRIDEGMGNWAGYGKRVVALLPDGREFGAGVKGDQAFTKKLLDQRDQLVGTEVTIRFFNYTPDGVPRFPVAVDFHHGVRGT